MTDNIPAGINTSLVKVLFLILINNVPKNNNKIENTNVIYPFLS
ncbi:hypothetical protein MHY_12170 [Megamonas hypermegale ART12/1]|nr:hypothetical protein MHY_12170 [Megamonas hypermegale ART12/1]